MTLKFGLISLGSGSSSMILDEAKKYFDEVDSIDIRKIEINVSKEEPQVLYDGEPLKDYDCLYMKGSYKYSTLLYGLTEIFKETSFIPIDSNAHIIAHNKFMTHLNFSSNKILKMPSTYYAAKISEAKKFLKTLNYPIILKFPSGTHGKGVIFAESSRSAQSMIDALDVFKQPLILQDYINIKSDIRVIVAGEKVVGAMRRTAGGDEIRANSHQGGSAEPFIVTPEIKKMSLEAAQQIKANVCAVDIVESDYGPLILEINTSPGLQKITEITKKNIAEEIVQYLYNETVKRREKFDKRKTRHVMNDVGVEEIGTKDFNAEIKVRNDKIILPEFVHNMTSFKDGEEVTFKISDGKIEIVKEEED